MGTALLFVLVGVAACMAALQAASLDGELGTCYHHVNPDEVSVNQFYSVMYAGMTVFTRFNEDT